VLDLATSVFPFIPPHVFMLAAVLVVLWVLFRWGPLIFLGFALWYFWHQELAVTVYCVIAACLIEWVKRLVMLFERAAGYVGPWV
jgi:hypothetical protein